MAYESYDARSWDVHEYARRRKDGNSIRGQMADLLDLRPIMGPSLPFAGASIRAFALVALRYLVSLLPTLAFAIILAGVPQLARKL